jgi:hypothetical protein
MEIKQTQVTDLNRDKFYKHVYCQQLDGRTRLVNLDSFNVKNFIVIDCCGWHYKKIFPNKNVLPVESARDILQYNLSDDTFFKLFNYQENNIVWPNFAVDNCAVVFDRSPVLKYQTVEQLTSIFQQVQSTYKPKFLIARLYLNLIDDSRLVDRFYNLAQIKLDGSVVTDFNYSVKNEELYICFQRKVHDTN